MSFVILLVCAGVIYVSCELFVNGVEWLGQRLNLTQTATGTLLAAFGTALPESAVTFVAVVFGKNEAVKQIGIGAALGGPLVLATISYAVVGIVLYSYCLRLGRNDCYIDVDQRRMSRDQAWFIAIFLFKIALGLMAFAGKRWIGLVFLAAYVFYVKRELGAVEEKTNDDPAPLKFQSYAEKPSFFAISLQVLLALGVIGAASHFFVIQLEQVGPMLGLSPQLVALLFSPMATELPETMNALIWVRQGKERLALANISGAMMIQATVPSALGLLFTPWLFDLPLIISAVVTLVAAAILFVMFRTGRVRGKYLMPIGLLYGVFIAAICLI